MGRQEPRQPQLFYTKFNLETRVRQDHPLRAVAKEVDFEFVYKEVGERYGYNGNVSVPPPTLVKIMFLLYYYDVRSERELMATIPERLDWLWFLGYDIDSAIPDHSVLSKARKLWGPELFQRLFERIVTQCVEAGLVDGDKLYVDASLVKANASNNSVLDRYSLERYLNEKYKKLETKLEELDAARDENPDKSGQPRQETNRRYVSTTDPDATLVSRKAEPRGLYYKEHRAVDEKHGVVTATQMTTGSQCEGELLMEMVEQSEANTGIQVDTAVADSRYGTADNYLACKDARIQAHLKDLKASQEEGGARGDIFGEEEFRYDRENDSYVCPAGVRLMRRRQKKPRDKVEYEAPRKACRECGLRNKCTKSKTGRSISRHVRQDELDEMRAIAQSDKAQRDLKTRQHLVERSFGDAKNRHNFKRARWRGLWRVAIQGYLIAAIQNIRILIRHLTTRRKKVGAATVGADARTEQAVAMGLLFGILLFLRKMAGAWRREDFSTAWAAISPV